MSGSDEVRIIKEEAYRRYSELIGLLTRYAGSRERAFDLLPPSLKKAADQYFAYRGAGVVSSQFVRALRNNWKKVGVEGEARSALEKLAMEEIQFV
ncbi:hypothetical protein HYU14_05315 [Candidatus Woesearchaeota archaeon]|nr:hypothetical protein [Candidatus Woesearchaeota archaeon]